MKYRGVCFICRVENVRNFVFSVFSVLFAQKMMAADMPGLAVIAKLNIA